MAALKATVELIRGDIKYGTLHDNFSEWFLENAEGMTAKVAKEIGGIFADQYAA
jgi:hypothetical protein